MFATVIFDWDGTLANTKAVILASFHQALEETVKIDVTDDFIERRIGVGAVLTFKEILKAKNIDFDEETIKRLMAVKVRVEVERTNEVELFLGAKALLQNLKDRVEMGLASMNNRKVIDHMVEFLKVKQFFRVILTGDEVIRSKPDPEIFLKTAQKLGANPKECVVIEDSIFGVKAAKAGGMGCVAVTQGAYSRQELSESKPDLIVGSLREKNSILRFILE